MKIILLNSDMSHLYLDHQSDCLFSQIPLYLIRYLVLSTAIRNYSAHAQRAIKCPGYCLTEPLLRNLNSCILSSYLKSRRMWKFFLFTSCRRVYWCVRDDSQLCLVCVHSLITILQLKKMSIMYESAHDAITFPLLEMSSITTSIQKQFWIFAQGTFFKKFLRENIGNFRELHNEKNQSGGYV